VVLRGIVKLAVALNSNRGEGEVAAGVAFGLLLALIPAGNLLWLVLLLATLLLKVNLAVELLFLAVFKLAVPLVDPLLDRLGLAVLTAPALRPPYVALYNMPVVPFTRFNNSLVAGGFLAGIAAWLPVYLLFRALVRLYRSRIKDKIENSKLYKGFTKLPLVSRIVRLAAGIHRGG
jgi:uncharacterized protein (TIGR03546 family)